MPGIVTHLVIADKVFNKLPTGKIKDRSLFFAGAIAPDAVHARKDYKREHKKSSHLRQDILDAEFHQNEYYTVFQDRLKKFTQEKIVRNNKDLDIDLGYLIHLISDEKFVLTVRRELVVELEKESISQRDKEFVGYIGSVMKNTDLRLVDEYTNLNGIKDLLVLVEPFEITNYLTKEELSISRNWVVKKYLDNKTDYQSLKTITEDRMDKYIEEVSDQIVNYLMTLTIFKD